MIRIIAGSAAFTVFFAASPAQAAESSCGGDCCCVPELPAPPIFGPLVTKTVPATWGGVYVGFTAAVASRDIHRSENGPGEWLAGTGKHYANSYSAMTGRLAIHAGVNHQSGPLVVGVEADVGYTTGHRTRTNINTGTVERYQGGWDASVRARAGVAVGNALFYGTAGPAIAESRFSLNGSHDKRTHMGATAGIGAEIALSPKWSARVETRYSDFEKKKYQTNQGPMLIDFDEKRVAVGLSYKF